MAIPAKWVRLPGFLIQFANLLEHRFRIEAVRQANKRCIQFHGLGGLNT